MQKKLLAFITFSLIIFFASPGWSNSLPLLVISDEELAKSHWTRLGNGTQCDLQLTENKSAFSGNKLIVWKWEIESRGTAEWGIPIIQSREFIDFRPFLDRSAIQLSIKGVATGENIEFRIEDYIGHCARWEFLGNQSSRNLFSAEEWTTVTIPLSKQELIETGLDCSRLKQIVFKAPVQAGHGELFIDAIRVIESQNSKSQNGIKPVLNREKSVIDKSGTTLQSNILWVDNFSGTRTKNLLDGDWNCFSEGDKGDIYGYVTEIESGNFAYESKGILPQWGGIYTDLTKNRQSTLDLSPYRTLQFKVRSDYPGNYTVRIENPVNKYQSTNARFTADKEFRNISIPLTSFSTGVKDSICMVWRLENETVGLPFHLVLDDIAFHK